MSTNYTPPPARYPAQSEPYYAPAEPKSQERNILGIVALVVAVIGFIFACIPGALIVGWVLLPISFILAVISFFLKGKKGTGIAALIVSIVGTIVGVIVFIGLTTSAVDEAFSPEEPTAQVPAAQQPVEITSEDNDASRPEADDQAVGEQGTRANPYPLGAEISQGDWTVTINGVTPDAFDQILAENQFNDPPAEGSQYLMVNIAATYTGNNPDGETPWIRMEYVTTNGNTLSSSDAGVVVPDRFDSLSTLYEGASTTGNYVFEVPSDTALEGTLAVSPDLFGDKVFVAVQ